MGDDDRRIDIDTIGRAIARPQDHFSGLSEGFFAWLDSHLPAGVLPLSGGTVALLWSALFIVPELGVLTWLVSLFFGVLGLFMLVIGFVEAANATVS